MKYNTSLDFLALALAHAKAGNQVRAAKCLVQAARESDSNQALQIIEHSNGTAMRALVAATKRAKAAKEARKVRAAEDEDFDDSIFDEDLREEGEEHEEAEEDEEEAEEEETEEEETEAMANVMASFFKAAAKKTKAAPKKKRK